MKHIIKHTTNLNVASNEYSTKYSIQRIIDRLFENDELLESYYQEIFNRIMIYEYNANTKYKYGNIIWYKSPKDSELHILRCDVHEIVDPQLDEKYPQYTFQQLGWKDLNPDIDIFTQYGLEKKINVFFTKMFKQHTDDLSSHRFGKISPELSSKNYIGYKVAKINGSNLNPQRENGFFPYETICLKNVSTDDAIIDGSCRWYDNGLLEYDIVFRLGYMGYKEIDDEYHISADILSCNNLTFVGSTNNDKYFYDNQDTTIFNTKSNFEATIGETLQGNRNDYVNVYSATLNFAEAAGGEDRYTKYEFIDTDYMVFCSNQMSQTRDAKQVSLNPSPNTLTFCKKTKTSITAILITYPNATNYSKKGDNASTTGLMSNSFHCHIVGRGKSK